MWPGRSIDFQAWLGRDVANAGYSLLRDAGTALSFLVTE